MAEFVRAYEGDKPYIFVSYSHKDSEEVLSVIEKLYSLKYRVWYDEGIAPGSEWPKNIADHLKGCSMVLVFASKNSLSSINCKNEVKSALSENKDIIEISLDGSISPLIDKASLIDEESLLDSIDEKYIGDGSGYDRDIKKGKHSILWIVLICLAIFLIVSLGIGLYGINAGWFDNYLPGLKTDEIDENEDIEDVDIKDSDIADIFADLLNRDDLTEEVKFTSEESKRAMYEKIGLSLDEQLSYNKLKENKRENIEFDYFYEDYFEILAYLPELKTIEIKDSETNDFTKLVYLKKLEEVIISYDLFPIVLPETYNFRVVVK